MSKNKWLALCATVCLLEAVVIGFLLNEKTNTPVPKPDVIIKEIVRDSLIRDSIFIEIEKVRQEIVYVEKEFSEDSAAIMSADDSTLLNSFSRYIENYNNK
jgi:hypothetical protein